MRLASGWVAFALSCLPWCRCRPGPPLAGLISSLSDPKGRDPSQFRRAVTPPRPTPTTAALAKEQARAHPGRHRRRRHRCRHHRDTLAAAAVTPIGRIIAQTQTSADTSGYHTLLDFARTQIPGQRCWAVEGTGSYGAGLACFLLAHGERVVEVGRPKRPASRSGAKAAPKAMRSTRSAPPEKRSPSTTHQHLADAATVKRCGCC
jgi:hypothetical protein